MTRNRVLLALLASSVIFLIGATPSTASAAANCTSIGEGPIYWTAIDSQMHFQAVVGNCAGVAAVEFSTTNGAQGVFDANDQTCCPYKNFTFSQGFRPTNSAVQTWINGDANVWVDYRRIPWCGTAHLLQSFYQYRIKNSQYNTWGAWHYRWSAQQWRDC